MDILNASKVPPFTIENDTDGGDDLRMQYRYLDLRRKPVQDNIMLRHSGYRDKKIPRLDWIHRC